MSPVQWTDLCDDFLVSECVRRGIKVASGAQQADLVALLKDVPPPVFKPLAQPHLEEVTGTSLGESKFIAIFSKFVKAYEEFVTENAEFGYADCTNDKVLTNKGIGAPMETEVTEPNTNNEEVVEEFVTENTEFGYADCTHVKVLKNKAIGAPMETEATEPNTNNEEVVEEFVTENTEFGYADCTNVKVLNNKAIGAPMETEATEPEYKQ